MYLDILKAKLQRILLLGLTYTPDGVETEAQDHSCQHLSCTIPTLRLQKSKLLKERN